MNKIKVYKERTMLILYGGDRVIIDLPRKVVDEIMGDPEVKILRVGECDKVLKSSVVRWLDCNVTDELEARVLDNYPKWKDVVMREVKRRRKEGARVNKKIIQNWAERNIGKT